MLRIASVLVLVVVLTAVAAAPAQASSAQRFADAVLRGKAALRAAAPDIASRFDVLRADLKRCETLRIPKSKRIEDAAEAQYGSALNGTYLLPSRPILDRIVADLDAIPTRDPALRSGRAAWRKLAANVRGLALIERPCERLAAWETTGYAPAAAPFPSLRQLERSFAHLEDEDVDARQRVAARRMRRLGVSQNDAQRFVSEGFFDVVELPEDFDTH